MNISFPSSLSPANLEKQMRAALGNNPPPTLKPKEISEAFKQLETVHKGVDTSLFQTVKLATAEAVEVRLQQIESDVMSAAKAAAEQARKVATIGKKVQAEHGKDKAAAKAVGVVSDAAAAASAYATDLMKAAQAAQAELKALLAKLEAESKKSQQAADKAKKDDKGDKEGEDEAEDLANHKDEKKFREKVKADVKGALQRVRKPENPPAKFMIAYAGKAWAAYLGKTSGEAAKKICARLLGQTGSVKYAKGLVSYIPKEKVWVFEGPTVPPGAGNARNLQIGLHALIGFKPKVRLQRPGEKGEDAEGEADPDEKDDGAKTRDVDADKAKLLVERQRKLKPALDQVIAEGGEIAKAIDQALQQFERRVADNSIDQANRLLQQIEADVVRYRQEAEKAKAKAQKEFNDRLSSMLPGIKQVLAAGGAIAEEVKRKTKAAGDAAQRDAKSAIEEAHKHLGELEQLVQDALKPQTPGQRVEQVARGVDAAADKLRTELTQRLGEVRKQLGQIEDAAQSEAAQALLKVAETEHRVAEAIRDPQARARAYQAAMAKAQEAADAIARVAKSASTAPADKVRSEAATVKAEITKQLAAVSQVVSKIESAAEHRAAQALLKAVEIERSAADKLVDAGRQLDAYRKALLAAQKAAADAKALASKAAKEHRPDPQTGQREHANVPPAAKQATASPKPAVKQAAAATKPAAKTAGAAGPSPADAARFKARLAALIPKIKQVVEAGLPEAENLRRKAAEAGQQSQSASGMVKANAMLGEVEQTLAKLLAPAEPRYSFKLGARSVSQVTQAEATQLVEHRYGEISRRRESGFERHRLAQKDREENGFAAWVASGVSKVAGRAEMPEIAIWDDAFSRLMEAREALKKQDFAGAAAKLDAADQANTKAWGTLNSFIDDTDKSTENAIDGAKKVKEGAATAFTKAAEKEFGEPGARVAAGVINAAEEMAEQFSAVYIAQTKKTISWSAVLKEGAAATAQEFAGQMVGGFLKDNVGKLFGSYLSKAKMSEQALLEMGQAVGLDKAVPREYFMTQGQVWVRDFLAAKAEGQLKDIIGNLIKGKKEDSKEQGVTEFVAQVTKEFATGKTIDAFVEFVVAKGVKSAAQSVVK